MDPFAPLTAIISAMVLALSASAISAAEVVLPQNRQAYYSDEAIEIAVAGLPRGASAQVTLRPDRRGVTPVTFEVVSEGSTVTVIVPPAALAPATYAVSIDGIRKESLTIVRGVLGSSFLVSQTLDLPGLRASGANFVVGNAFGFGLLDSNGEAATNVRRRSPGMDEIESAVGLDLPSLIYMYWTGYILHKPWGNEKSWLDGAMTESMRLFNFHAAQRLRRYGRNILSIGTIDEPGLAWGRTPSGGTASGFPNWNEQAWYEQRGWEFTGDPAARPADDWMKYLAIRTSILAEQTLQAKRDLHTVWPEAIFSTDFYAVQALLDGTEPLNQRVNDMPMTHVFADWGYGKLGIIGALYLEKAHDPLAKVAHAMNGQLFARPVPQPTPRHAYHLMMSALLAAGVKSNWWLNFGSMTNKDLRVVNEPAARLGPLFVNMTPEKHDVAVLWSFTELGMRLKDVTAKEAARKAGEAITLRIDAYPETILTGTRELAITAYSVGENYRNEVLAMFQAINRAGYPAHIVHEALLPAGALKSYKTLVIVGQTFEPPAAVQKAIEQFVAKGGTVIVDKATTVRFPGAIVTTAEVKDAGYRWALAWSVEDDKFPSPRRASYYKTNYYMDEQARGATLPIKASLRATRAMAAIVTDSAVLGTERHYGGEGELVMVLNGHEALPDIPAEQRHDIYNHAPYQVAYRLAGVASKSTVYRIEGLDWKKVSRVGNPAAPQKADFAPGEMKLYLIAPRRPRGVDLDAKLADGKVELTAKLKGLKMPWPLQVTLKDPKGDVIVNVYRSMNARGEYRESLALGLNAPVGPYTVRVSSPVASLSAEATVRHRPAAVEPRPVPDAARVFDSQAIMSFLAGRPAITVAIGSDAVRAVAGKLAAALVEKGFTATVQPERSVWRKARYPRVWDPYIRLYRKADTDTRIEGMRVLRQVALEIAADGTLIAVPPDGTNVGESWRRDPGTLALVTGGGFIDFHAQPEHFYEPGCKLYVDDQRRVQVVNGRLERVPSREDVRATWSRPWERLHSYSGAVNLVPQLPEAYAVDSHLILLGDSQSSELIRALQASEVLLQVVDDKYPGPGKSLVSFAWSPFAVEKNVILIGATDKAGLEAGITALLNLAGQR